jgi:hypothetical protein
VGNFFKQQIQEVSAIPQRLEKPERFLSSLSTAWPRRAQSLSTGTAPGKTFRVSFSQRHSPARSKNPKGF